MKLWLVLLVNFKGIILMIFTILPCKYLYYLWSALFCNWYSMCLHSVPHYLVVFIVSGRVSLTGFRWPSHAGRIQRNRCSMYWVFYLSDNFTVYCMSLSLHQIHIKLLLIQLVHFLLLLWQWKHASAMTLSYSQAATGNLMYFWQQLALTTNVHHKCVFKSRKQPFSACFF